MDTIERFDSLGRPLTAASRTVAGNAASLLAFDGSDGERLGVLIHNHSSTYKLFLKLSRLDAGEAMSATNKHVVVPAEATIPVRAGCASRAGELIAPS